MSIKPLENRQNLSDQIWNVYRIVFDFNYMGYWAEKLASEGKIADAAIVSLVSGMLLSFPMAEQNLTFCPPSQCKTLRNGKKWLLF